MLYHRICIRHLCKVEGGPFDGSGIPKAGCSAPSQGKSVLQCEAILNFQHTAAL